MWYQTILANSGHRCHKNIVSRRRISKHYYDEKTKTIKGAHHVAFDEAFQDLPDGPVSLQNEIPIGSEAGEAAESLCRQDRFMGSRQREIQEKRFFSIGVVVNEIDGQRCEAIENLFGDKVWTSFTLAEKSREFSGLLSCCWKFGDLRIFDDNVGGEIE